MTPTSSSSKPAIQFDHLRRHLKQDPHLSPTSIRNLLKHFTSSDSASNHSIDPLHLFPSPIPDSAARQGQALDAASQAHKSTHRQPHKRQVRRRLHAARPYQDRLLNMAEARKEIVTALKFHRASLHHQQHQQAKHQHLRPTPDQDGDTMSPETNPTIYQSCTNNFPNLVDHFTFSSSSHPPLCLANPLNSSAASPSLALPHMSQNLSFSLPNRTLGLNLNFHNFDNLDAAPSLDNNKASFSLYSSPSSLSSPSFSVSTDQEVPSVAISQGDGAFAPADAIDSDAATQVSPCPQFVKNTEHQVTEDDAAYPIFDALMEFPDWFNPNETCFEHNCSQEFVLDPTLPCMEIGDFEGVGEEWLV